MSRLVVNDVPTLRIIAPSFGFTGDELYHVVESDPSPDGSRITLTIERIYEPPAELSGDVTDAAQWLDSVAPRRGPPGKLSIDVVAAANPVAFGTMDAFGTVIKPGASGDLRDEPWPLVSDFGYVPAFDSWPEITLNGYFFNDYATRQRRWLLDAGMKPWDIGETPCPECDAYHP